MATADQKHHARVEATARLRAAMQGGLSLNTAARESGLAPATASRLLRLWGQGGDEALRPAAGRAGRKSLAMRQAVQARLGAGELIGDVAASTGLSFELIKHWQSGAACKTRHAN